MTLSRIIVGTDFSSTSKEAIRLAVDVARSSQLPITIRHAFTPMASGHVGRQSYTFDWCKDELERQAAPYDGAGITVSTELLNATPEEALAADTDGENLLVLGRHAPSLMERVFGQLALRMVRKHVGPVLILPAGVSFGSLKTILIAEDASEGSHECLTLLEELELATGAQLHSTHVIDERARRHAEALGVANGEELEESVMHAGFRALITDRMKEFQPRLKPKSWNVHIEDGLRIVDTILEQATELGADLLCSGATGKGAIDRLLLGSVTEELVERSPIPLLIA